MVNNVCLKTMILVKTFVNTVRKSVDVKCVGALIGNLGRPTTINPPCSNYIRSTNQRLFSSVSYFFLLLHSNELCCGWLRVGQVGSLPQGPLRPTVLHKEFGAPFYCNCSALILFYKIFKICLLMGRNDSSCFQIFIIYRISFMRKKIWI